MAESADNTHATARGSGLRLTLILCGAIIIAAGGVVAFIFATEPTAQRSGATRESAMLVATETVQRGTYRPELVVLGRVAPAREVVLRPRVSGQIIARDAAFDPGAFVAADQLLVRIEPDDYEHELARARSERQQAAADLQLEQGRQDVARQDYELLDRSLSGANRALVLREPQLASAQARLTAADAAVARAELDLQRTRITAPFAGQVLTREVNEGSQVNTGDPLGRMVGVDTYWVVATVPLRHLRQIVFADDAADEARASAATIRDRAAWEPGVTREARVARLIGALDRQTRLARVLLTVDDPLARTAAHEGKPSLLIDALVETRITGRPLTDIVRLDRDWVRDNDTVWVMDDEGELAIRHVRIVFSDARYAYIRDGLKDGARVVTTNLSTVAEGAPLRVEGGQSSAARSGDTNTSESGDSQG